MKIGYRIVAALCAVAVIIVALFVPIVSVKMDSLAASLLVTIGQARGNEKAEEIIRNNNGQLVQTIGEEISVADLFSPEANSIASVISSFGDSENEYVSAQLDRLRGPALTFLVTFVLLIVCAIVTIFVAFFTKDNRKIIYCSLAGIGLSYMLIPSFKAISAPFLDGSITLGTLSDSILVAILGDISNLSIGPAVYGFIAAFAIAIVWTILYNYTLPEKEKEARKIMLGEAD